MSAETASRQPKGIPSGGQFAADTRAEPGIGLSAKHDYAAPLPCPAGSRVLTGGQFGTVSQEPDRNDTMIIKLDGGGSLITKSRNVAPWDAHLDIVMPAVDYNPDPETTEVPARDVDRFLRASLTRMRNTLESADSTGGDYYQGLAFGAAEVAASLMDADSDPEKIGELRESQLRLGLPLGAGHEDLSLSAIKGRAAAPLTSLRARRLAGYFTARSVAMQDHLGSIPQSDWAAEEWTKQGAMYSYAQAAVRFASGVGPGETGYHEERFNRLLAEGESNANTIIGETFDEEAR